MKNLTLKTGIVALILCLTGEGCHLEEDLPPNHAKGVIIEVFGGCYGEFVLIEVENPNGIGLTGTFYEPGKESEAITYNNAIGVPYFSKIGLADSIPQAIGTRLYFQYRQLTGQEKENLFLSSDKNLICPANIIPPKCMPLLITKVISYN